MPYDREARQDLARTAKVFLALSPLFVLGAIVGYVDASDRVSVEAALAAPALYDDVGRPYAQVTYAGETATIHVPGTRAQQLRDARDLLPAGTTVAVGWDPSSRTIVTDVLPLRQMLLGGLFGLGAGALVGWLWIEVRQLVDRRRVRQPEPV